MNGVVVLDKPAGWASAKASDRVKKAVGAEKAGHTGTLDPFATGVLPVCLNEATKAIPYLGERTKEYEAEMILGTSTDTMDSTGTITRERDAGHIVRGDVETVLGEFAGEITQIPPMYSAAKVAGTRLYKLARKGTEVERKPKTVIIEKIRLVRFSSPRVVFYVKCSRGTYVRALASDMGERLGCGAHLCQLRRLGSGAFSVSCSSTIEDVESGNYRLFSLAEVLGGYPRVEVGEDIRGRVRNGAVLSRGFLSGTELPEFGNGDIITVLCRGEVLSVCEAKIDSRMLEYSEDNDIVFRHLRVFC